MNLQALYDLKERLEYSAIAGTGLLQEDFRLKRAVDSMAPLAAASPVFAKISSSVNQLLEAPAQERSKQLLDALSLVDAVVYTQGTVGMSGEMTTINPNENSEGKYIHVSYSQLQPLITSLTTTGSGRMAIIEECKNTHPEFFEDFRVLPYVVAALGDSYAEIPDLICEILRKQGKEIIPLLKEGFDPAGKKDMVRRAMLIWEIAGSDENEWYISVLPEAKKDIREIIIKALGESKENEKLLFDLYKTEKGKMKEAVLYALAKMNSMDSVEYWKKELDKNLNMAHCLVGIDSEVAADMAVYGMRKFLEEQLANETGKYDSALQMQLNSYQDALVGKYSLQVYDLWMWIAPQMSKFDAMVPGDVRFVNCSIGETLQISMLKTILWNPCKEVFELGRYLGEKYPEYFMNCYLLIDLIEQTSEIVFDKYSHYLLNDGTDKQNIAYQKQLLQILNLLHWDKKSNKYCIEFYSISGLTYLRNVLQIEIKGFDKRWLEILTDAKRVNQNYVFCVNTNYRISSPVDKIFDNIINPEDEEICKIIGKHLYQRVLYTGNIGDYLTSLIKCAWSEWKGLITHCVKKKGKLEIYYVRSVLNQSNMSNAQKIEEIKELENALDEGKTKISCNKWERDHLKRMMSELEETDEKIFV